MIAQNEKIESRQGKKTNTVLAPANASKPISEGSELHNACTGVAVVAEGGGQRGIFTAGVLDTFLEHGFNPFAHGIGVSAGAQNLLSYFLQQQGFAKRAITELTASPQFFVPYRWLAARSVIDLDSYFDATLSNPEYQLPYQQITQVQSHRQLIFVATNRQSLQAVYLEPNRRSVVSALKASSAVPFLYKAPVKIGNESLVDGGVADPLPIQKAIDLGARHIVVIRTVPKLSDHSGWRQRIDALPIKRAIPRSLLDMLEIHEHAYAEAIKIIRSPPANVHLFNIAPSQPLHSHAFGSRSSALIRDYESGREAGSQALNELHPWLLTQVQSNRRKILRTETESLTE